MSEAIIILSEEILGSVDVENITDLYGPNDDVELVLLVPAETKRNLLVEVIDQLTLLDVPAALRELTDNPTQEEIHATAQETLTASLAALKGAGAKVTGKIADGNAVASLVAAVDEYNARQAVVVTVPRALEDTFRQDWASQAQRKLGLPVLHLYAGSGFIGDS